MEICTLSAITSLVVLSVYKRRNRARWVTVVLIVPSVIERLLLLGGDAFVGSSIAVIDVDLAIAAMLGAAALLLVVPSADRWYAGLKVGELSLPP